jgi:hypothetical protein
MQKVEVARLRRSILIVGIYAFFLLLNLTSAYAETDNVKMVKVNYYDFTREYDTIKEVKNISGVKVTVELDVPRLLIDGEHHNFTYRIIVGNAPPGWLLNITEILFAGEPFAVVGQGCGYWSEKLPATILTGNSTLTKQFTVKIERKLRPGFSHLCFQAFKVVYYAQYGPNQKYGEIIFGVLVPVKSKELPLELSPNISAYVNVVGYELSSVVLKLGFAGEIRIKNNLNWDISLSHLSVCRLLKPSEVIYEELDCRRGQGFSSVVIKSGEEYALSVETDELALYFKPPLRWDNLIFVLRYSYPGEYQDAISWIAFKLPEGVPTVATEATKSPRTATMVRTTVMTAETTKAEATRLIPATTTRTIESISESIFTSLLVIVPIVLVAIAVALFAVRWLRNTST